MGAPSKRRRQSSTVNLPHQITPNASEEEVLNGENNHIDPGSMAEFTSGSRQTCGLDLGYSFPDDAFSAESAGPLHIFDDNSIGNTVTWPWLHEDLFLFTNTNPFALSLDPTDVPALRTADYTDLDINDSHAAAASFPPDNFDIQYNGNANPSQTTSSTMAANNEQNDTSAHAGMNDEIPVSSTQSVSRSSFLGTGENDCECF